MIENLLSENEELEFDLTPNHLRVEFQPAEQDGIGRFVFSVSTQGIIRPGKRWVEFLAANLPSQEVGSFVDGLATIDQRMRPNQKPDGTFSVPKGRNAANLESVVGKLDTVSAVVSSAVRAVEAVSTQRDQG